MKSLMHSVAGLALLLPLAASAATLGSYPATETCQADREASYAEGYSQGYSIGESNGFNIGHRQGHEYGINTCVADPLQFGVTLGSVIPAASYGETEPNDNFIAADPLAQGVNFWGQLYGTSDQDWFYTETTAPNQNILVTFSVPYWISGVNLLTGLPAVWNISVRDAAGNVFANFNTNVMGAIDSYDKDRETFYSMTYSITAGLAGTYYVVVKPVDAVVTSGSTTSATAYPYSVATVVQDSPLVNDQPVVGFFDSEVEPNDVPSRANPLATGVSMYGLINLTFNTGIVPDPEDPEQRAWAQGEDDWYVYNSRGNEIVSLEFCTKDQCERGNWFVEVYDQATATRIENGASRQDPQVVPLLAFNTDNVDDPSATYRIGLRDPGYYLMRVSHKRLFAAPCVGYLTDIDNNGLAETDSEACACAGGEYSCKITIKNPEKPTLTDTDGDPITPDELKYELCPDGSGGDDDPQCEVGCVCVAYGGVVEIPEGSVTSSYNFTWHGTQLPPNTIDTDAYEDYWNRPNPYTAQ